MTKLEKLIQGKYFWILAFALHLLVLLVLYSKFGINISNEGDKYISIAKQLTINNFLESIKYLWFYSTYIVFLAACFKIGLSLPVILFIQYVFSLIGFHCFYKFIFKQSLLSELIARICILLIVTSPVILYWQFTFYTESFFLSLVMISTYLVFNSLEKRNYLWSVLSLILLLFCRAVGIFYVIALVFVFMKSRNIKFSVLVLLSAFILVFIGVLFVMPLHYTYFALPVFQGSVICGFPGFPNTVLPEGDYTLAQVYSAFLQQHDFVSLASLFFKKIISFFTLTRPYYSFSHNVINAIYYVFIIGGLVSILKFRKTNEYNLLMWYFASVLKASVIIVMLIYNEWSERFMVPLLPFFILLTLIFISKRNHKLAL